MDTSGFFGGRGWCSNVTVRKSSPISDILDDIPEEQGKIYSSLFFKISVPFKLFRIFRWLYVHRDIEYYNVFLIIFQEVAFPALWPFGKNGLKTNAMMNKACIKK